MNKLQKIKKRAVDIEAYARLLAESNENGAGVYASIIKDLAIEIEELLGENE